MNVPASIDVHAHCVPVQVLDRLRADGGRYGIEVLEADGRTRFRIAGQVETAPLHPGLTDPGLRRDAMDKSGVKVQILSSWIDLTAYALPAQVGARYSRMVNESIADLAASDTGRYRALATVPLQADDAGAGELAHAVGELGMVGVEIATTVAGRDLDDPALEPFWSTAEALQCLVLLHPCASLAGRGVERYFLGNLVGNPAESTIAVGHLVFGGVLERHPGLRLCVVHGGGFAPYQLGRWDHAFHRNVRGAAQNLTRPPSEWVSRLYHDTVLHSTRSLGMLVDLVGPTRVVLGSDYPFEMGDPDPLGTLAQVPGLSEQGQRLIRAGNLLRLLGRVTGATRAGGVANDVG